VKGSMNERHRSMNGAVPLLVKASRLDGVCGSGQILQARIGSRHQMTAYGTFETSRNVCFSGAVGGKADIRHRLWNGSDL